MIFGIQSRSELSKEKGVNITCMMVLASVYISVSSSLPLTAAIKNIEIWLLFNLAFPVLVILINIIYQVKCSLLILQFAKFSF